MQKLTKKHIAKGKSNDQKQSLPLIPQPINTTKIISTTTSTLNQINLEPQKKKKKKKKSHDAKTKVLQSGLDLRHGFLAKIMVVDLGFHYGGRSASLTQPPKREEMRKRE